jgi:hypothetical protein
MLTPSQLIARHLEVAYLALLSHAHSIGCYKTPSVSSIPASLLWLCFSVSPTAGSHQALEALQVQEIEEIGVS